MAGVFTIVSKKIGEGGDKRGTEVKRLQQLLSMAGYTRVGTPDGSWGKNTTLAWMQYQEEFGIRPARPFLDGHDPANKLFDLADRAGVLIPLPSQPGAKGLKAHLDTVREIKLPYGWHDAGKDKTYGNGTMMTWGLALNGDHSYAICTKPGGRMSALFDKKVPRASNCTAFANVLLSIWFAGNLHYPKYSASQDAGGTDESKNLGLRYGLTPLAGSPKLPAGVTARDGLYTSLEELQADTTPGTLYHVGICTKGAAITHDTVLLDGDLYECNHDRTPACYSSSLEDRWERTTKGGKYMVVSGPA
jgi:hypothetical protein